MIKQTIIIPSSTSKEIYEVLLDSHKHAKLTGDKAKIDPKVGGTFSIFGDYATGENIILISNKLIKQTWRASDWPQGHYSTIKFELSDKDGSTEIKFTQSNLPKDTEAEFESGWEDFYWTPLKKYFSK